MNAVITFDLVDAEPKDYEIAYTILAKIGLQRISKNKGVKLPNNTVMGELTKDFQKASELREHVLSAFESHSLVCNGLFGGILEDWAVRKKTQKKKS